MRIAPPALTSTDRLVAIALMAWFICGSQMIMQDDSWWHLRTGELIWETASVPLVDPYSWTLPPGTFWANHEWLSQVLYFLVYRLGSFPAVNFCGAVVIVLAGFFTAKSMNCSAWQKALALLLMLPWLIRSFSVRPHIFTLLGMAVFLLLMLRKKYWYLPLLFFFWAQLHAGVVLALLFLLVFFGFTLFADRNATRSMSAPVIASALATMANPLGPYLILYPFAPFKNISGLPIIEWMAPGFSKPLDIYFWMCAATVTVVAGLRWRRLFTFPVGPLVFCTFATMIAASQHVRHVYIWFMIAPVCLSYLFSACRTFTTPVVAANNYSNFYQTLGGWVASLALVIVLLSHPSPKLGWQPVTASGIRALARAPMPTFNSYGTGGFILWFTPERKVFMDSRQDPYPTPFLKEAMETQMSGDFGELFRRFGIRSAIVERPMPLVQSLINSGWHITYDGYYFTVLIKDTEEEEANTP